MKPRTATLLIHGPDRRGLVARSSGLLFERGVNILDADQLTEDRVLVYGNKTVVF